MTIFDVINYFNLHLGRAGTHIGEFLFNGGRLVHEMFTNIEFLTIFWFKRVVYFLFDGFATADYVVFGIYTHLKRIADDWWERTERILDIWWDRITQVFDVWWERLDLIFVVWWENIVKWFDDWMKVLIPLFDEHEEKILFGLTEGWPKVWWFINDRWVTLFGSIEGHIDGWQMFVDDPAQAIWDWVEPRMQELGATFLVKLW